MRSDRSSPLILLVDDEHAIRDLRRRYLMGAGFGVLEAGNVADAISLLGAIGRAVDLLLADTHMPDWNCGELIRCARDRWPDLAILCLPAKPIAPQELVAAVQRTLRETLSTKVRAGAP